MNKRTKKRTPWLLVPLLLILSFVYFFEDEPSTITSYNQSDYDYTIVFPSDRYPETALHIQTAISEGHSAICTIDREGADNNRKLSLNSVPTRDGFDRDEWPMAVCEEGGTGASVAYISPSDNRGAGSWVGNQISDYSDGSRVLFILEDSVNSESTIHVVNADTEVYYENCAAARKAGATPLKEGDPGYRLELDRDRDGIACQ